MIIIALEITVLVLLTRNKSQSADSEALAASYWLVKDRPVVDDDVFTVGDDKDMEDY